MELLKYVYYCEEKSLIKAGINKFQDLINAPHEHAHCNVSNHHEKAQCKVCRHHKYAQ